MDILSVIMKYHVSVFAVASVSLLETAANMEPGAGAGANWYLRGSDGSHQGPYERGQLGEWSAAGYVSPGKVWRRDFGYVGILISASKVRCVYLHARERSLFIGCLHQISTEHVLYVRLL